MDKPSMLQLLPAEIICLIIDHLPCESLAIIRLCLPGLDNVILRRLFRSIHVTFTNKHLKKLQDVAASPHIAPHVQELIWMPSRAHGSHSRRGYVPAWRTKFFECLDTMPNLHTFVTAYNRPLRTKSNQPDGLSCVLLPAISRSQSLIASLRCQDPLMQVDWLKNTNHPSIGVPQSPVMGHAASVVTILRIDVQGSPPWMSDKQFLTAFKDAVEATINLRRLCVRWNCSKDNPRFPKSNARFMQHVVLSSQWQHLRTLELDCCLTTRQARSISSFIKNHAATLRHVALRIKHPHKQISSLVSRLAQAEENIKLHRFILYHSRNNPCCENRSSQELTVIPEQLVLDFINSIGQARDPFAGMSVQESDHCATIADQEMPFYPDNNDMISACRQCEQPKGNQ
ncbi:hypothetical protein FALBO_2692 [Fusarium albosuccineum]|uniref:F-box domain-containing protein n=1 Tax=Fusarium albosuccineum TaxID=1237068 RepID=A0A8H4LJN8_9HYPO|nr:hypothetical protein FALBO_2692 [Fusarium albosuccineum]